MQYSLDDTIVAVASPPGGGIRGIIRMAGPHVSICLSRCFVPYRQVPEGGAFLFGQSQFEPDRAGLVERPPGKSSSAGGETGRKPPSEQKEKEEVVISETHQAGGCSLSPSPLSPPPMGDGLTTEVSSPPREDGVPELASPAGAEGGIPEGASSTGGEGRTIKVTSPTTGEGVSKEGASTPGPEGAFPPPASLTGGPPSPAGAEGVPELASSTRGEGRTTGLPPSAETVPFSEWLAGLRRPVVLPGELRLEGFSAGLPCEVYYWPGPRSYTGGPQAEIHTVGCGPLLEAAIQTFCRAGARLAEAGEFTLRAFLSGRMDLTQAEAVLGVVDATDGQQLAVALEQLAGGLARPLQQLRNQLLELVVHLEAGLDFPEEDLPFLTRQHLADQLQQIRGQLRQLAEQLQTRRTSSEAITVVLVGRPNAGKSSLFNALLGHQQAIVSPWPGTTRDYLVGQLDLDGLRCQLVDTAGLDWVEVSPTAMEAGEKGSGRSAEGLAGPGTSQETHGIDTSRVGSRAAEGLGVQTSASLSLGQSGVSAAGGLAATRMGPGTAETTSEIVQGPISIEAAAQQMTARQIQQADLLLWCVDGSQSMDAQEWAELGRPSRQARLVVLTKADQPMRIDLEQLADRCGQRPIPTSSRTGQGLEELRRRMRDTLESLVRTGGHAVWATALRSAESIRLAREAIDRALELTGQGCPEELVTAELRLALDEIGKVSGAIYTEDLLDQIFIRFCIGK